MFTRELLIVSEVRSTPALCNSHHYGVEASCPVAVGLYRVAES